MDDVVPRLRKPSWGGYCDHADQVLSVVGEVARWRYDKLRCVTRQSLHQLTSRFYYEFVRRAYKMH